MGFGTSKNKNKINAQSKEEIIDFQIASKLYMKKVIKICQISNERIGILFNSYLLILSLNSLKTIYKIEVKLESISPETNQNENSFFIDHYKKDKKTSETLKDAIELKNNDIVIWSNQYIYVYNLSNKEYKLYQIIKDIEVIYDFENFFGDYYKYSDLYSVIEITNCNFVSCNSLGIKIYEKQNDKYELKFIHEEENISRIIGNTENLLFMFLVHPFSSGCTYWGHDYYLSVFDFKKKQLKNLSSYSWNCHQPDIEIKKPYFLKNEKYLIALYGIYFEIYEVNKNCSLFYKTDKKDIPFAYIIGCINDNLLVCKDFHNNINIYEIKNYKILYVRKFPIQNLGLGNFNKIKKNKFLFTTNKGFKLIEKIK